MGQDRRWHPGSLYWAQGGTEQVPGEAGSVTLEQHLYLVMTPPSPVASVTLALACLISQDYNGAQRAEIP